MILIRADANSYIGTGHVMRCSSVAHAFFDQGKEVLFVTADHDGDKLVASSGLKSICMDSLWTKMEEEPIEEILSTYHPELLIVDSYFVTEEYFHSISNLTRIAYIDDMNRTTWDVDYIINYNVFGTVLDYESYKSKRTRLLLGPMYAPLRAEFRNAQLHSINEVSNVLISAGGADPEGITEKLMMYLCQKWKDINFHFIVGILNPRLEKIKTLAKDNIILHVNEKNVADLMQSCDIAISAAGSTLYELCAMGTPTITYTLADNQIIAAEQFETQGIMLNAGDCRGDSKFINRVEKCMKEMMRDNELRRHLSWKMQTLVDGNGAERIAEELIKQQ